MIAFGQPIVFAQKEYIQEVRPGDNPLIIEFDEVNSYLLDLEIFNNQIDQAVLANNNFEKVTDTLKEIDSYKKSFDTNVEFFK